MATKRKTVKAAELVEQFAMQAPAGAWQATIGVGYRDAYDSGWEVGQQGVTGDQSWVRFLRDERGVRAVVVLNVQRAQGDWELKHAFAGMRVEGHTLVNGGTFTRVGVDVSSCELVDDKERQGGHAYGSLAMLLAGEWDRCVAAAARAKTAVGVPGLPFSRQPEWFASAGADLKAGKPVRLAPAGFGTGYTLSTRKYGGSTRADAKLESLLGVGPVFVSTFDHD